MGGTPRRQAKESQIFASSPRAGDAQATFGGGTPSQEPKEYSQPKHWFAFADAVLLLNAALSGCWGAALLGFGTASLPAPMGAAFSGAAAAPGAAQYLMVVAGGAMGCFGLLSLGLIVGPAPIPTAPVLVLAAWNAVLAWLPVRVLMLLLMLLAVLVLVLPGWWR